MTYRRGYFAKPLSVIAAVSMLLTGMPQSVFAEVTPDDVSEYSYDYTRNATLMDAPGKELPGVYVAKAQPGDTEATMGIPSLAKQNLDGEPTTESPAIIKGAAVPFERRVNSGATISFDRISDEPIYAPYSLFRYSLLDESNANTTGAHTKISGYDGTYVLLRIDVSELINAIPEADRENSYLHFKQTDNRCMLVALGEKVTEDEEGNYSVTFSDALGGQAGSFSLKNSAQSLKDTDGPCQDGTYVTLILMSSGTLVAGADTGKEGAPPADFPISFYVDQQKDYEDDVDMIWDSATNTVLKKSTRQAVAEITEGSTVITPATQYLKKFYDETKASSAAAKASYKVKGSDLELEVAIDETSDNGYTDTQYWSLRRAMDYEAFDEHTIKLLCEVPMLEGLTVSGSNRRVALDLNSFDFQLANHSTSGAAAITVQDGATLTLTDGSRTTGAELAVGNNAKMLVTDGGTLVIDESCQMEVEYDAATTPAPTGEPTPTPTETELTSGVLTIENGGRIVNNGVINVEGRENKALDPTMAVIRDTKDAVLSVSPGGTIENNGCMRVNGMLFNEGTIINNGRYTDTIESNDPDKGHLIFHKGIQISWKDDVTQGEAYGGSFINGMGFGKSEINPDARIENNGDLVLVPGNLFNLATIDNSGDMILSATNEVIVPITPTQDAPTVMEERVQLTGYADSMLLNSADSYIYNEGGSVYTADFELVSNGRVGNMKDGASSDHENIRIVNFGEFNNSASGYIDISRITNYGKVSNDASSTVNSKVILLQPSSSFADSARKKTADVYNAKKTTNKTTDSWSYVEPAEFTVSPSSQMVPAGESATWTVRAKVDGLSDNDKVQYLVGVESSRDDDEAIHDFVLPANKDITVTSPVAPADKTNVVYTFTAEEGVATAQATLRVNDDVSNLGIVRPVAMPDLVYNGMPQHLLSLGNTTDGEFQYRINGGDWSYDRPMQKNAGEYTVDYRIVVSKTSTTVLDNGGTVKAVIAKRPLYIAANDLASKNGETISELTYTAYGLCESDKDSIGLVLSTSATKDVPGDYPINIVVDESAPALANYEYKNEYGDSRITGGVYYVSKGYLSLTPDPVTPASGGTPVPQAPGIKSNLGGYQNLNCGIVLTAKYKNNETDDNDKAVVANVYYSSDIPLTGDNYSTDGKTIAPTFAAVGTDATVYYCVAAPEDGFAGSQRVVITKADQEAPGIKGTDTNGVLEVTQSTTKNVGGSIKGLQTMRSASKPPMEYRSADSAVYSTPTASEIKLPAGTYYFRRAGDARYNPSPDTEVTLTDGTGKLSVTYNANKGKFDDNTDTKTVEVYYGDLLTEQPTPVRTTADGSPVAFKGWTLYGGKAYDFSRPVTSTLTLYAEWDVKKYTVTFDHGNDYSPKVTVEEGEKVNSPDYPITGYTINGWKTSDGASFDFDTPITSDITLTADKTPYSYTVKFDGNGGSASSAVEAQNFNYGEAQALNASTFTREGYTFAGWNTMADGKGVAYADKEKVINLTETDNGEVTLYAQWIKSLSDSNISVTVGGINEPAIYKAPFNGKAHRPNVTVKDGTNDITAYCRFEYSNNTSVTDSATITILPKSDTVPYSGRKEVKFTIEKVDAPQQDRQITRNYIYNDNVSETIDLSAYVPDDAGAVKWKCEHSGNIRYKQIPVISGSTLSYTIRPASGAVEGTITLTAVSDNYNDITVNVKITETSLGLYEKVSNKYYRRTDAKLLEGKKMTLAATFADESVENRKVVWTSSNPTVASVSQTGVVTAYSAGTTTIQAISENDTAITATCNLTVEEPVTSVSLSEKSYGMGIGERFDVNASILPFTAEQRLEWTTSKEGIVRIVVSEDTLSAEIIALGRGNATVTATAADGSGKKASVSVSVGEPVPAFDIVSKNKDNTIKVGATTSFKVDWKGSKPKNTGLYWRVSTITGGDASKIASIDPNKGVLKGLTEGAVRVTAVSTSNNEMSASTQVYVYNPVKNVALNMTTATVSMANGAVKPQLIAYVTPVVAGMSATGTTFGTIPVVKFEVDSKYRANLAVDVKGFLTAKAATKDKIPVYATVTAYNGYSKTLTCKVSVSDANPLKSIKMSQSSIKIGEGNKAQLSALFTPVNPDGGCGVEWSSADTGIATVDSNGIVIGKAPGRVTITAKAEGTVKKGSTDVHPETSCTVTVVPSVTAIEFIDVGDTGANIATGKSLTIKTKLTDVNGNKASTDLKWTSSNEAIATVSSKGVVKGIAPGTATITATSLDNKATGTAASKAVNITVKSLVTSITADKTKLTLGTREGAKYGKISIANVLPDNVSDASVEWTADSDIVKLAAIGKNNDPAVEDFAVPSQSATTAAGQALAVCADKPGSVKITGKTTDGSNKKLTVTVTVRGDVTSLRLSTKSPDKNGYNGVEWTGAEGQYKSKMKANGSIKIAPLVDINYIPADTSDTAAKKAYGTYKKYTDIGVSYRSSDVSVATVDKNGTIKVDKKAASGSTVTIYASCAAGEKTVTLVITVD